MMHSSCIRYLHYSANINKLFENLSDVNDHGHVGITKDYLSIVMLTVKFRKKQWHEK